MTKKNSIIVSSISSNQGKTLLTTALLYHFRDIANPFKIGPDYIDTQFHKAICNTPSINLDGYLMNEEQIKYMYNKYSTKPLSIIEGVMGYYDGMDKNASSYDISRILNIPTVLILDASGTYITLLAIIKGLVEFRPYTHIKGVILNKVSSQSHYNLIKDMIQNEFDNIEVLGWIQKELQSITSMHLGLNLDDIHKINLQKLSQQVLQYIDLDRLYSISSHSVDDICDYPFDTIKLDKKVAIVYDENFSFLYYDNYIFLQEIAKEVVLLSATKDETIDDSIDVVYIVGGYVETSSAYDKIRYSTHFRHSLIQHAKSKPIYAECAGMILLSKCIDDKQMYDILPLTLSMQKSRQRLGYYIAKNEINNNTYKGHAFHYSKVESCDGEFLVLQKGDSSSYGGYRVGDIVGTYLHTMLRSETNIIKDFF